MSGIRWKNNKNNGFTIVEIIVAIAIIVSAFGAILGFFSFEAKVAERERMKLKAISLAEEAMEATRNFRDNTTWSSTGIGNLSVGIDYHPASSSAGWGIVSGIENINEFSRKIVFNKVSRDANSNIESTYNPSNDDSNTRKVIVTISWADREGQMSETIKTYITNWRE
jgi:prepilin-type N-terminal cleavage/methylation domain-containing protein